jgi:hypothetical protein
MHYEIVNCTTINCPYYRKDKAHKGAKEGVKDTKFYFESSCKSLSRSSPSSLGWLGIQKLRNFCRNNAMNARRWVHEIEPDGSTLEEPIRRIEAVSSRIG